MACRDEMLKMKGFLESPVYFHFSAVRDLFVIINQTGN